MKSLIALSFALSCAALFLSGCCTDCSRPEKAESTGTQISEGVSVKGHATVSATTSK